MSYTLTILAWVGAHYAGNYPGNCYGNPPDLDN